MFGIRLLVFFAFCAGIFSSNVVSAKSRHWREHRLQKRFHEIIQPPLPGPNYVFKYCKWSEDIPTEVVYCVYEVEHPNGERTEEIVYADQLYPSTIRP